MSETAKKSKRTGPSAKKVVRAAAKSPAKRKTERAFPYVRILIGEMVLIPTAFASGSEKTT